MIGDVAPLLDGIVDISQMDGEGPGVRVLDRLCEFDCQVHDLLLHWNDHLAEERKQSSRERTVRKDAAFVHAEGDAV